MMGKRNRFQDRRMLRLPALALLALALAGPALAAGAIAVDDDGDGRSSEIGYGISTGHGSREAAARGALAECRRAGNDECRVVVRFDACGAYAVSRSQFGVGWGGSERAARAMAQEECGGDCRIVVSGCD